MTVPGCVGAAIAVGSDRLVLRDRLGQLGQAEVEDLDVAVLRDHQVLGLQVPVDDAGGVGLGQALGGLDGDIEQPLGRQRLAGGDELAQGLSLDQLHGDVEGAVGLADVVDGQDVGMIQGRGRAGLLLEALAAIGIRRDGGGQDLDRDLAPELRVPRPVDLAHPARARAGARIS